MAVANIAGGDIKDTSALGVEGALSGSGMSYDTTNTHSPGASVKAVAVVNTAGSWGVIVGTSIGFASMYVLVTALPASARVLAGGVAAGQVHLKLNSDGTIGYYLNTVLQGTSTTALTDTTHWYLVEWRWKDGTTVPILRVDGVDQVTGSPSTWTAGAGVGPNDVAAGTYTAYFDDVLTDDAAFPGPHNVVLLLPTSDNAAGSWKAGSGASASANGALFDGVDNTPPVGTISPDAVTACISNAVSGATLPNYDANMNTYASKGIAPQDTILAVQAYIAHGEDIATGTKTGSFTIVSNPALGSTPTFTFGADVGAVGLYSLNWRRANAILANPSGINVATAPVMRVTKTDTGTRAADCCFMGIYVAVVHRKRSQAIVNKEALHRASRW